MQRRSIPAPLTHIPMTLSLNHSKEARETISNPGFQSQWAQLHQACPWATAFQSPGYITAWYEAYKDQYNPLVVSESSAALATPYKGA